MMLNLYGDWEGGKGKQDNQRTYRHAQQNQQARMSEKRALYSEKEEKH